MFLEVLVKKLHEALYHNDVALKYLRSRFVTDEEMKEFEIGYSRIVVAQDDGSADYQHFLNETGKGRRLEGKVVLPIRDMVGRVIGLFGRSIEGKDFLYYLTEEGKETGALFGFYQSLPYIYETGRVFLVEGPFDFLAFHKVYKDTVGCLTAELTEAQHKLLSFYAPQIITVFDSDGPGRAAVQRAKEKWPKIISVGLIYKDPDWCLKQTGDRFKQYVERKVKEINLFATAIQ